MFYAFFVSGHYFIQERLTKFCISDYSFKKLVFRLSAFFVFCLICFEFGSPLKIF